MILPTKHLKPERSLLGVGSIILQELRVPATAFSLWEKVKSNPVIGTFERFSLGVNFLYIIGAVAFDGGQIVKVDRDT